MIPSLALISSIINQVRHYSIVKHYLLFSLFLLISIAGISQASFDLEGSVLGAQEEPLQSATVVLLSQADSTLVSFGLTDEQGRYKIMDVKEGQFLIQVTFLGYDKYIEEVSF